MTLDDETAERIARTVLARDDHETLTPHAECVAAGYAARDAEVEELRVARDGWASRMMEFAAAQQTLARVREWAERVGKWAYDSPAAARVLAILDESPTERETSTDEWEYQYIPVTEDGEEWAGRSREECDELIRAHADPNHWIHQPHNDDLHPVVSYRVERRRKAGPWEVCDE